MASNQPKHTNRLAGQASPYLLQHAHNPVDWWPWGEGAFAEARKRDVPIFLSIGYSTCYWCHVMERESFESEAIAAKMNERFVCVKVDREERPDVDDLYMAAVQAFTGGGGWPMSVFIEPGTLRPFWAGTYFPAEPRFAGMPTFPQVLENIAAAWKGQRAEVMTQAAELADAVRERVAQHHEPIVVGDEHVARAVGALLRMFDRDHGGFGANEGPKFPQPIFLELLLDARHVAADSATAAAIDAAVRTTLDRMALGGIHDHVGGGFHRYSVDRRWIVPHFEKMLYDNAQLLAVYARAAVLYDDAFYRRTAARTAGYILHEMTDPQSGAFFSAQDAEVNHREGQNYLWTRAQFEAVLGVDDAAFAAKVYGLDRGPNFRDPHHPPSPGEPAQHVLVMTDRPETLAAGMGTSQSDMLSRLDRVNARLYEARLKRDQPLRDDKRIAAWNGLTIRALASAGVLLNESGWVSAAARAAAFVLSGLRESASDGALRGLVRAARHGQAGGPAVLEDYAMVVRGLIEVHRAGADKDGQLLKAAVELGAQARRLFGAADGGFYDTQAGRGDLFVRARSVHDGALPSGGGEVIHALLDLAEATGDADQRRRAIAAVVAASADIAHAPAGACNAVRALMRVLAKAPGELQSALDAAAAGRATFKADDHFTPVEVLADTDRVTIAPGRPASLMLRVRIAEDYHINAFDPAPGREAAGAGLVPFRVHIVNGAGASVYADYPAGEAFGTGGELRVYRGQFDLPVAIEAKGVWSGQPLLAVTYQPCTDDRCLEPRTVELDVAVDRG